MPLTREFIDASDPKVSQIGHPAPPWLINYADLMTELCCFFIILFSMSTINAQTQLETIAKGVKEALTPPSKAGEQIQEQTGDKTGEGNRERVTDTPGPVSAPEAGAMPAGAQENGKASGENSGGPTPEHNQGQPNAELNKGQTDAGQNKGQINVSINEKGIVISIPESLAGQAFFDSGKADLKPVAKEVLSKIDKVIATLPNNIIIEGHTDNIPISTAVFPSNWELSTARATNVLRYMVEELRFPAIRIAAAGYGEHQPVAANDNEAGRAKNRRVEIIIQRIKPLEEKVSGQ